MTSWEYFLLVFVGLTVWRAILNRRVAKSLAARNRDRN